MKKAKKVTKKSVDQTDRVFETLFTGLATNPQLSVIISSIKPYIPALKRAGVELFDDVVSFASKGLWTEADRLMWTHMSDDERNELYNDVLNQSRDAVDRMYERQQLVKETTMKVAMSVIMAFI